jgi:hypothetical protein
MALEASPNRDRRRPAMLALCQPAEPARLRATIAGRPVLEEAIIVELTDRTLLVEVRDAMTALAFSVAPEVVAIVDLGGGTITWSTEPSRREQDAVGSRHVLLVLRERR